MLRAVAWMLVGALLAGGLYFFYQRKTIENDTPESARARAERLDPVALERKIIAYKTAIEKRSAELEKLTAVLQEVDYKQMAAEQIAELNAKIAGCRESLERQRENLSAYEEAFRNKISSGE